MAPIDAELIAASLVLALTVRPDAGGSPATIRLETWTTSAEALFLTVEEQNAWAQLADDAGRERFVDAYWQRRDPNPATSRNEFRDTVAARIAAADEYFALAGKRGSQTARGRVFVLLGPASLERQVDGPLDTAPRYVTPFGLSLPQGALEHREWHTWVYDARRKDLLSVIRRPSLELSFLIDPARGDALQNPGRLEPIRRLVADSTIHREP